MNEQNGNIEVSFIVPAKNEGDHLPACLNAIQIAGKECKNFEIIVVDNNSTDNTGQVLKRYHCTVINNIKPGAAASRNAGSKIARGKYLAFIDADCVIHRQWAMRMIEHLNNNDIVAAGTKISPDMSHATWVQRMIFDLNNRPGKEKSDNIRIVKWIGTSNLMIRRKSFYEIDGFNDSLITCEDVDFSRRITRHGQIILDRNFYTIHLKEDKDLKELFLKELWRGQDSYKNWKDNGFDRRESLSVFVPILFLMFNISGFLFLPFLLIKELFLFIFVNQAIPLLMVLRALDGKKNPIVILKGMVIYNVYLIARGISLVRELYALYMK